MPARFTFTSNKQLLERALRELGAEVAGRLGEDAVRSGAQIIRDAAEQNAPVRTGRLKRSMRVFDSPTDRLTKHIGTWVYYAYFVEYGTIKMSPRSFLRRARDENKQNFLNRVSSSLNEGIERVAAKYRGRR